MQHAESINHLQEQLLIPVSRVTFHYNYIEIISGEKNIGCIPFTEAQDELEFDLSNKVIHNLSWKLVYAQYAHAINEMVKSFLSEDQLDITPGFYRQLKVCKTNGKLISIIECRFQNNWKLTRLFPDLIPH